jgi:hypothetical protein
MNDVSRRDSLKLAAAASLALAAGGVAAAQPPRPKHDLEHFKEKVKQLRQALQRLADSREFEALLRYINKPGWTTPAEFLFATGLVDSMFLQTKALAESKQALVAGSRMVSVK